MKKKLVVLLAGAVLLASCNRNGSDNQMGTDTEVDSVECVSASEQVLTFQDLPLSPALVPAFMEVAGRRMSYSPIR